MPMLASKDVEVTRGYLKQLDGVASASGRTLVKRRSPRSTPALPWHVCSKVTQSRRTSWDGGGASSISRTVNRPCALQKTVGSWIRTTLNFVPFASVDEP